jgi:hypothetical protein
MKSRRLSIAGPATCNENQGRIADEAHLTTVSNPTYKKKTGQAKHTMSLKCRRAFRGMKTDAGNFSRTEHMAGLASLVRLLSLWAVPSPPAAREPQLSHTHTHTHTHTLARETQAVKSAGANGSNLMTSYMRKHVTCARNNAKYLFSLPFIKY